MLSGVGMVMPWYPRRSLFTSWSLDRIGRAGEFEDLAVAGRDPVAAVGVRPGDRALGVHLLGDGLELVTVFWGMPVEMEPILLAIGVG